MRRLRHWMIALLLTSTAVSASAQSPPANPTSASKAARDAARVLAQTGKERFDAGDYRGAIDALRDAEKYYSAPTITLLRALAHEKLGELVEARAIHEALANQELADDAPAEFKAARESARQNLPSLDKRIPSLEISVLHAPAGTRVSFNGKPLDAAALAAPLRLNPGKYTLSVEPPQGSKVTRELDLPEGARDKAVVDLAPPPSPPSGPPPASTLVALTAPFSSAPASGTPSAETPTTDPSTQPPNWVGPGVAYGVGGMALILGAITGGLTFANVAEIRKLCGDDLRCQPGQEAEVNLEGRKTIGYVSTAAFAVAGAGALVGTLWLVFATPRKKEPTAVGLRLSPTFFGVKGAF